MNRYVFLVLAGLVTGCSQTAEKIENAANRSTTGWAMGKPYSRVVALGNSPLEQFSTEDYGFGQMIGQSTLADGTTLYRHIALSSKAETTSDFGSLYGREKVTTNYRLSYFKVGQDGIVKDWATGSVPGSFSDCVSYIAGIFEKCTDQGRIDQALAVYDNQVKTSAGASITSWGPMISAGQILQ